MMLRATLLVLLIAWVCYCADAYAVMTEKYICPKAEEKPAHVLLEIKACDYHFAYLIKGGEVAVIDFSQMSNSEYDAFDHKVHAEGGEHHTMEASCSD